MCVCVCVCVGATMFQQEPIGFGSISGYKTAQAQAIIKQQEQLKKNLLKKAGQAKIQTTYKYKPKKK